MNWNSQLRNTATRIFESLCFLIPEPDGDRSPGSETVSAQVTFHGPFSGTLAIVAEKDLAEEIARLTGGDDAPEADQIQDVIGEMANLLCGNALPEIAGDSEEFVLDAPAPYAQGDDVTGDQAAVIDLTFDEGAVRISMHAEPEAEQYARSEA